MTSTCSGVSLRDVDQMRRMVLFGCICTRDEILTHRDYAELELILLRLIHRLAIMNTANHKYGHIQHSSANR